MLSLSSSGLTFCRAGDHRGNAVSCLQSDLQGGRGLVGLRVGNRGGLPSEEPAAPQRGVGKELQISALSWADSLPASQGFPPLRLQPTDLLPPTPHCLRGKRSRRGRAGTAPGRGCLSGREVAKGKAGGRRRRPPVEVPPASGGGCSRLLRSRIGSLGLTSKT